MLILLICADLIYISDLYYSMIHCGGKEPGIRWVPCGFDTFLSSKHHQLPCSNLSGTLDDIMGLSQILALQIPRLKTAIDFLVSSLFCASSHDVAKIFSTVHPGGQRRRTATATQFGGCQPR